MKNEIPTEEHLHINALKNGGGITTEIIVHPANASMADFDWRMSMADVAQDGPFSIFPGIDRTLCILEGAGMSLSIDEREPVVLAMDSDPRPSLPMFRSTPF